jgi:AraC-like DNA-binding protein
MAHIDRSLFIERGINYLGSATIKIEHLYFPHKRPREEDANFPHGKSREEDEKKTRRLEDLFRDSGCHHYKLRHHVPAIIDERNFNEALTLSNISMDALKKNPTNDGRYLDLQFPPDFRLTCLHGRHRVLAGGRVLPRSERRWTVDLYDSNISTNLKIDLIDEYSAEQKPDDGEFYSNIRKFSGVKGHAPTMPFFEKRWRALLKATSKTGSKNLRRILTDAELRERFDIQLDLPGLSEGMRLTTLHKGLATQGLEEILHYLDYIIDVFRYGIFQNDPGAMRRLERRDVKALQGRAPGACAADRKELRLMIVDGSILRGFTQEERDILWTRILGVSRHRLIPSLSTFFDDLNYFELLAWSVKWLVQVPKRSTIKETIYNSFTPNTQLHFQYTVQETESEFVTRVGSDADRRDFGYRQVMIGSMRDYPDMPAPRTKKDQLAKPTCRRDRRIISSFADLAYRVGLETPQILSLRAMPDASVDEDEDGDDEVLNSRKPPKRSATPLLRDHQLERPLLFLDWLHQPLSDDEPDAGVSPFFIRRSVYFAFFGQGGRANTAEQRQTEEEQRRAEEERRRAVAEQEQRRAVAEEQRRTEEEQRRRAKKSSDEQQQKKKSSDESDEQKSDEQKKSSDE